MLRKRMNKRLIYISISQIISDLGNWFYTVAISTYIYAYTQSALLLSAVLILNLLPSILFSFIGGVFTEKINPKKAMIISDLVRGIITLFALLSIQGSNIIILYIISFITPIFNSLFTLSRYKIMRSIIEKDEIPKVFATLRMLYEITVIIGAASGGIVYAFLGFKYVIIINSLTFFISMLFLGLVKFTYTKQLEDRDNVSVKGMVIEGLKYIRRSTILKNIIIYKLFYVLSGSVLNILPSIIAIGIFSYGEMGTGIAFSSIGVGAFIGAYLVKKLKTSEYKNKHVLVGGIAFVIGWTTLFFAPNFYIASLSLGIVSIGSIFSYTYTESFAIKEVDPEFLGRVTGTMQSVTFGAMLLSLTILGKIIDFNYKLAIIICIVFVMIPNVIVYFGDFIKKRKVEQEIISN